MKIIFFKKTTRELIKIGRNDKCSIDKDTLQISLSKVSHFSDSLNLICGLVISTKKAYYP